MYGRRLSGNCWHTSKIDKKEVSAALDDSSRYVLAGDEFDAATGENSINIVEAVLDEYGWIRKIEQAITDRGANIMRIRKTNMAGVKASSMHS